MNLISKFTEIYEDCVDYYKSLESEGFNVAEEINCNDNEWSNILAHGDNIQFMKNLFIFLWSLLFIIPGIIKTLAYFAVPFILAENPDMPYKRALQLSKDMTMGHKGDIFVMGLSFIGWTILTALTAGIVGAFHYFPYLYATEAEAYAFLREEALMKGITTIDELPGYGEPQVEAPPFEAE